MLISSGSIADREHSKWLNATAEIPNNPYSPEALEKRLQGSTNSIGILSAPQSPTSIESTSIVSQANSENERDIGEEKVVQGQVKGQEKAAARSLQDVLGDGEETEKSDFKR